ncbi:voltage-dependent T-type calcium channel subunit alpha-1H isoform X3 [Dermochelys coriacea]|uniref:voltage-dependent T-type calcium channel subunit alpha-1H isoform X3 n=1 Tax=Dermochelys coriacea TaxID=27794 RepID=UPI0018E71DD0|nr:voltage-dependent T-type calcium channel subunit alpha-1H isoform X3 [Dermochelys coriacea]
MTDGERREPFQSLASDEVRVPIASLPSQAAQPGEDEDVLSPCKSIQGSLGSGGSSAQDPAQEDEEQVPYPALAPTVFFCLKQTTRPRSWCLRLVCNPWFEHVSMLVILLNCVTLGMFQPCEDVDCKSERCTILEAFDHFIFAFFAVEMVIKMVALGIFGQKCYLGDTWNRLDFFIVMAGMMEYSLDGHNVSLSAIRTVRVLRPLRAINRVPSMRILVTLLLDTLPMLGNVLLLCFFVFFIFGIVGVQLWAGLLRNRCFLDSNFAMTYNFTLRQLYYQPEGEENPFICSSHRDNGMQKCSNIPNRKEYRVECTLSMDFYNQNLYNPDFSNRSACINWNQYYNVCKAGDVNPHNGAINFDNIGYAWIAIFQVITLEGWVDIMYYVMDAHSFYNFIYFILLIIVGSFFMINLCLVVIATQFSETKQRENQLMKEQRARYLSNDSTIASFSEPGSCYDELLKYICHIFRKVKRRTLRLYNNWQSKRRKKVTPNSAPSGQSRRSKKRITSIHHLIHHHHHHHHHYHISNGSPRGLRSNPEICDLELKVMKSGSQLILPSPSPNLHSPPPHVDSESVHSIYHADCHVEGPQVKCKSSNASASIKLTAGLTTNHDNMNYPTILPSPASKASSAPVPKGKESGSTPVAMVNSPVSLNAAPFEKLHQLMGEHGLCRTSSRLSGLNVPCPLPSPQPSILTCELQNCPYCANILEDPEFEFSESDSYDSDNNGVYEFTQDLRHGDQRDQIQQQRNKKRKKKKPKERNKVARLWVAFGNKLKRIVESKYFNRGIMIAILINTLSMGIEYHEQPDELTNALEISNIVFTSMFALEMVLKLLAFGIFGYIKNPYNIFDGIIVIISVWEIIGQSDGGLSVLRTFRLLRVLKLVRFMPALRRQLVVLMKTMDNVATFCMLLMLFIFIFSILGMHLFGCKFSLKTDTGDTVPDRKNFDSLLWAIVTVFQILTQEDWNVVLYNGMASTSSWAALYFVALMTFGNYVLFNLLVAILVEGFQAEGDANRSDTDEDKTSANFDEDFEKLRDLRATEMKMYSLAITPNGHVEGRGSVPPPIIMRTAATPMPTPKCSPHMDSVHTFVDSRRGSNASVDPLSYDQKSLSSLRSSPCANWGPNSNWGSRRSSWNSLGRAPSLKKKSQSGERESLLSGEGKGSTDDDSDDAKSSTVSRATLHRRAESLDYRSSLDLPELLQLPTMRHSLSINPLAVLPTEYQDCNGKMVHVPGEFFLRIDSHKDDPLDYDYDDDMDDSYCYRIRKALEPYKPEWWKNHEDWSLYLFSPQNRIRAMCQKVIAHKMFDHVVLVFIFLNCITIALERPDIDPHSMERIFLSVSNYIFTAIFVVEMMVKVVALGFFSGENTYLQSSWNVLDGILVFVSIIDIIVSMASAGGAKILGILRVLRLLRTLRPLRVISRAPGLKLVVETLISSLRPIGNIVLICCAFFIIFGILGVQLFKGKFYYCEGPDTKNISTKADCTSVHYRWVRRKYNFDNLGQALMSLFVLSSKDGWVNIMYNGLDAVGIDQQPVQNHNPWMLLYFISFLLIVSFFVLNMFVGVVVENFHKCRQHQEAEEARRREEKRLRRLEKKRRSKELYMSEAQRRPYYADYSPTRRYIHTLCTSHYLDLFITFIIGVNVITMSMEHYNQPKTLDEALKYCNYVFTIVFVFEAVLKLVAFGFRRFFKDRWNQLDLAIVLLSIMGITLEEIEMNAALPINPTIIRIMRVLRIARVLKLLKMATGMRALLDTVVQALPQVGNLGLLFMLLFFIYAALGVELFGKLDCSEDNPCEGLSRHATFTNFGMAFLTLFRVSTGDNWNGIMKDTLRECTKEDKHCLSYLPVISPVYFVTFVLIAQFVLVNVVVAVLMKHLEESNKEAKEDAEMDAEIELEMSRGGSTPANSGGGNGTSASDVRAPYGSQEAMKPESPMRVKHQALEGAACMRTKREPQNFLTVRKISVSRMHSLPNDSYMFRPVMPAKAPYPLHEVEMETYPCKSQRGSVTSIRSQPVGTCSSLRVPRESLQVTAVSSHHDSCDAWKILSPQSTSQSPSLNRLLCRQEAVRTDSLDGQNTDSKDNLQAESSESLQPKKQSQSSLGPALLHPSPLSQPGTPPHSPTSSSHHRCSSVRTRKHTYSQHSISSRPSSQNSNPASPENSLFESSDLADEEVSHINSSVKDWQEQPEIRSRSVSPFISPASSLVLLKNCSTASLAGSNSRERDLKKFYSVDTKGFLDKPSWADDQRRHSIEICPSIDNGDGSLEQPAEGKERSPVHIQSELEYIPGARRKKKMSPPCISIDPPMEDESSTASRTKASENSMLRRRTPSCESTAYRDSLDVTDNQPGEQASKAERRVQPPCRGEHLTIPNFSFEQSDPSSSSSLSDLLLDSGQATPSSIVSMDSQPDATALELKKLDHLKTQCNNPEKNKELLGITKSPIRRHELVPMTVATDEDIDKPV